MNIVFEYVAHYIFIFFIIITMVSIIKNVIAQRFHCHPNSRITRFFNHKRWNFGFTTFFTILSFWIATNWTDKFLTEGKSWTTIPILGISTAGFIVGGLMMLFLAVEIIFASTKKILKIKNKTPE